MVIALSGNVQLSTTLYTNCLGMFALHSCFSWTLKTLFSCTLFHYVALCIPARFLLDNLFVQYNVWQQTQKIHPENTSFYIFSSLTILVSQSVTHGTEFRGICDVWYYLFVYLILYCQGDSNFLWSSNSYTMFYYNGVALSGILYQVSSGL